MKKKLLNSLFFLWMFFIASTATSQTSGTLTFTYTPVSHMGYSGTKHVLAVWIQTSSGGFVKTKLRYAGYGTSDHLPTWAVNSGGPAYNCMSSSCNTTDGTTGATLTNYATKTITWDGKNVVGSSNGSVVADGVYKVTIQETWGHGSSGTVTSSFSFTKGPSPDHQTPADTPNFTNIILDWNPSPAGIEENAKEQEVVIYPNPSQGIFNVNYIHGSKIKVSDLSGAMLYQANLDQIASGSVRLDLSDFNDGIYVVTISHNDENWNYKVILNK